MLPQEMRRRETSTVTAHLASKSKTRCNVSISAYPVPAATLKFISAKSQQQTAASNHAFVVPTKLKPIYDVSQNLHAHQVSEAPWLLP